MVSKRKTTNQRQSTSRWRGFELLVARIEHALSSPNIVVKSPDRIRDKRTGRMREVDATIRYKLGSVDIVVTIECRDRTRTQDVTWIEQLHSKQEALGISKTIAVSSQPFSEEALKAATAVSIETRILSEVQDADIQRWANPLELSSREIETSDFQLLIEIYGDRPLTPAVNTWIGKLLESDQFNGRFIYLADEDDAVSPIEVLGRLDEESTEWPTANTVLRMTLPPLSHVRLYKNPGMRFLLRDVPSNGTLVDRSVRLDFDEGSASIRFEVDRWLIKSLTLRCSARCLSTETASRRVFRYAGPSEVVADVSEQTIPAGQESSLVAISVRLPGKVGDEKE